MITALAGWELSSHLKSFRFLFCTLTLTGLILVCTFLNLESYSQKLRNYHSAVREHQAALARAEIYPMLGPVIDWKPEPLGILAAGVVEQFPPSINLHYFREPEYLPGVTVDNDFLPAISEFDITHAVILIAGLLGLLMGFDAINGERRRGTLSLMLSNSVSRGAVIAAKSIAGIIVITFSLGVGMICFLIVATRSTDIVFTLETCARIAGFEATAILYTSVFFLLGILSSAALRTPAASLSLCLSVWLLFAVVWIPAANSIGRHIIQVKPLEQFIQEDGFQQNLSFNEVRALYGGFADNDIRKPISIGGRGYIYYTSIDEATLNYLYRYVDSADRVIRARADREWQLRSEYTAQLLRQESYVRMLSIPSPSFVFSQAATILSRTDAGAYRYHFDGVREYNRQFLQWLSDRNARHSRKWFVTEGALDLKGFPQFSNSGEPLSRSLYRACLPLSILLLFNVLLFWCAHVVFVRKDIQ